MKNSQKEITISIILDYHLLSKAFSLLKNKDEKLLTEDDLPQIDFLKKIGMPSSYLGIFLCEEEFDSFIKPYLSVEGGETNFGFFLKSLLNRPGNRKRMLIRSSFIEKLNEERANTLKNIFIENGFSFKFQVFLENPISLFIKDFFSLYYQIPSNFRFSKPESFFQNIFKEKMKKIILGLNTLSHVFGDSNVSFLYNEDILKNKNKKNKIFALFSELGIENYFSNEIHQERLEINPLFLEYIRCKLLEGSKDIHSEVSKTREMAKKFKLKNTFSYKGMSTESIEELESLSKEIENFLPESEKPLKKFLFIKTDTCSFKHVIPFISQEVK